MRPFLRSSEIAPTKRNEWGTHLDGRARDPLLLREAPRRPPANVHRRRVARLLQPPRHVGHVPEEQLRLSSSSSSSFSAAAATPAAGACRTLEAGNGRGAARYAGADARALLRAGGAGDGGDAVDGAAGRPGPVARGGDREEAVAMGLDEAHAVLREVDLDDGVEASHPGEHLAGGAAGKRPVFHDGEQDDKGLVEAELLSDQHLIGLSDEVTDRMTP